MIYISYPSALRFWLDGNGRRRLTPPFKKVKMCSGNVFTREPFEDLKFIAEDLNLPVPLSLMAPSQEQRSNNRYCTYVTKPVAMPEHSFIEISRGVYMACPELCFLSAARDYSLCRLVELGMCLCGTYAVIEGGQKERIPVTSVSRLKSYIDRAQGCTGVKQARTALKFVKDNSNSPMESKINAFAALSMCHGGMGINDGVPNGVVKLSAKAREHHSTDELRVDILWRSKKVGLEYDSTQYHTTGAQLGKDNSRKTALNQDGYKILTVTAEDLRWTNRIESKFLQLAQMLGYRRRKDTFDNNQVVRRRVIGEIFMNDKPIWEP